MSSMDPAKMQREVKIVDPAYRDQDGVNWRTGRFAERVRREWNKVPSKDIDAAGDDLQKLAEAVHSIEGGDEEHILARLRLFAAMEQQGAAPTDDGLVAPGQ